jgi:hypothetical protein
MYVLFWSSSEKLLNGLFGSVLSSSDMASFDEDDGGVGMPVDATSALAQNALWDPDGITEKEHDRGISWSKQTAVVNFIVIWMDRYLSNGNNV